MGGTADKGWEREREVKCVERSEDALCKREREREEIHCVKSKECLRWSEDRVCGRKKMKCVRRYKVINGDRWRGR